MRTLAIAVLLLLVGLKAPARNSGFQVQYLGGTLASLAPEHGAILVTDETFLVYVSKHCTMKIPYERINMLEYGQKVDRRYILAAISPLFLSAKKREHFLTVGFENENGHEEALLFRIDKDAVRIALIALEARTGKQIEFQDEDARLAGKG